MAGQCEGLLWFHSFDRGDHEAIVKVVLEGPTPNPTPNPDGSTRINETRLGIEPHRVYAYLGRTLDKFGDRAIATKQDALVGEVSPFDTGGLVEHIYPVCEWSEDQERVTFLQAYTWNSDQIPQCLSLYPGVAFGQYLREHRPDGDGPHEPFGDRHEPVCIWSDPRNESWQAWTWEGRTAEGIEAGEHLVAWSCLPEEYADLLMAIEQLGEDEVLALPLVVQKYIEGGVSTMIVFLRAVQEANCA